jgi:hypothetical protein
MRYYVKDFNNTKCPYRNEIFGEKYNDLCMTSPICSTCDFHISYGTNDKNEYWIVCKKMIDDYKLNRELKLKRILK